MSDSDRKIIVLTGAPLASSLGWSDQDLSAPVQDCFSTTARQSEIQASPSTVPQPTWRSLPLEPEHLPTGLTQLTRADDSFAAYKDLASDASFLSTTDLSFISADPEEDPRPSDPLRSPREDDDLLTRFYEHSFAIHEEIKSSQVVDCGSVGDASTDRTCFEDSYLVSSEPGEASSPGRQRSRTRLLSCSVSDIADVPNANYLQAITPQTMTVNLIMGIISIPPPRFIKTRRGGRTLALVEMLVGDDTKAGFGINFWFPDPPNLDEKSLDLQSGIAQLRPQDIVLAENVALSSFRGKVYGQSLRRGMTTLNLLYRNTVDASDKPGAFSARELEYNENGYDHVSKMARVRRWVMDFVGGGTILPQAGLMEKPGLSRRPELQELPSDTP